MWPRALRLSRAQLAPACWMSAICRRARHWPPQGVERNWRMRGSKREVYPHHPDSLGEKSQALAKICRPAHSQPGPAFRATPRPSRLQITSRVPERPTLRPPTESLHRTQPQPPIHPTLNAYIKWSEIERLVEEANRKIERRMHKAVDEILADAAKDWAKAIAENPNVDVQGPYTEEEIRSMLSEQWDRRYHATRMRVQLFVKDFTWGTLNDPEVRRKIEEAYPDIRETGLYKSRSAWAS